MGVTVQKKRNHLYLVYSKGNIRKWESLGLKLTGNEVQDLEVRRLEDLCRSKRETQILSNQWGLIDPVDTKKSLLTYAQELAAKKGPS